MAILQAMSYTIGCKQFCKLRDSEDNEDKLVDDVINVGGSNYTVCLGLRIFT